MKRLDTRATGVNMKRMMRERGLSIKDIQHTCNFGTDQTIYKWFRGQSMPSLDNLVIVADLFKCKVDDILIVV